MKIRYLSACFPHCEFLSFLGKGEKEQKSTFPNALFFNDVEAL